MPTLIRKRPRLLLVSMYPLDQGRWGPTVRISHLRDELSRLVELDVVDGYRGARRLALMRYATSGRLRALDGVYVESSTFLPAELDIAFLGLARSLGIPVLTYVRDAYQLFDDYARPSSLRARIGRWAFRPALRALESVSTQLGFPTPGLARAVIGDRRFALLPPGSPAPVDVPRRPGADQVLFVGDARLPAQGAGRLQAAVRLARERGASVNLTVVARPGQEPPEPHPEWMRLVRAEGDEIVDLLPDVLATVIPRPRGEYNDLALPIKLFDYLAYGRPLLVTDCIEQAAVVRDADAGIVTGDSAEALANGIARIAAASIDEVDRWSANAHVGARDRSWAGRARHIVTLLAQASS